jgi:Fe-S oxidoreductase
MAKLISGEDKSEVLSKCTSCFSCNLYCPNDCKPYDLILYRWFEKYKKGKRKIPTYLNSIIGGVKTKNLYFEVEKLMPYDEQKAVRIWRKNQIFDSKFDLLFLGCNQHLNPYITFSSVLDKLKPFALKNICCGEPYYRIGALDKVYEIAKELEQKFKKFKGKKIVFFCPACYNMFINILPQKFGIKFNFKAINLLEWLCQKIENDEIKIKYKLNKTATIQDSCHSKMLGKDYQNLSRKILNKIGIEVIEMEHTKENALCCGLGAYAGSFNPIYVALTSRKRLEEANRTGAQILCTYCNGCFITFSIANLFTIFKPPLFHIIELLNYAVEGRYKTRKHRIRALQLIKAGVKSII